MAQKVVAPCKLCDTVAELRDSHIFPRWGYRRTVNLHDEPLTPVRMENGTAALNGRQASEHMLCGACEDLFGKTETYVSTLCMQQDGTFPARDGATIIATAGSGAHAASAPPTMDCEKIAFFGASVLWRASVSRTFPKVSLGGTYEPAFNKYLRGGAWPSGVQPFLELMRREDFAHGVGTMLVLPHSHRQDGYRVLRFALFGMHFQFFVGSQFRGTDPASLLGRTVILSDGDSLLRAIAPSLLTVERKGKLALTGGRARR